MRECRLKSGRLKSLCAIFICMELMQYVGCCLHSCCDFVQSAGDADEQGGSGDHANGVQRSGSGPGRNAPKGGRGRPARGRGQMRGDMGMGGPMAPMGAGMMGGMQAMPGQMFVLAPGKPNKHCMSVAASSLGSTFRQLQLSV